MARNRVIYQSQALYAASTGDSDAGQLIRVQDVSHTVDIARQDINEFGKLAAIDRAVVEPPTVGTDFSYYLGQGDNETGLGLVVRGHGVSTDTNCISGLISNDGSINQKNLYVRTVAEGEDVANIASSVEESAIGIGNAYVTDYTINAAVGDIPTVNVSTEATNMNVTVATSSLGVLTVNNPGIHADGSAVDGDQNLPAGTTGDQSFGALRPGDIELTFGSPDYPNELGGAKLSDMHVQNISFNLPLGRTSLNKLGSKYAYYKAPDLPITATMNASAIMSTAAAGNLSGILCSDASRTVSARFKTDCGSTEKFVVTMKGATLDSQNFSSSIGDNQTVDLTWSAQIGSATDTANGLFLSGVQVA